MTSKSQHPYQHLHCRVNKVASVQNLTTPHGAYVSFPSQKYAGLTKIMCHAYVSLSAEKYAGLDVISPKLNAKQALHQTVSHTVQKSFLPRKMLLTIRLKVFEQQHAKACLSDCDDDGKDDKDEQENY